MGYSTPPVTPIARRCRRLRIPDNPFWLAVINGALFELINERSWEQVNDTDLTPEEAANVAKQIYIDYRDDGDDWCMAGRIFAWTAASPPKNALLCNGQLVPKSQYPELANVLGDNGAGMVAIPDMRARLLVGTGQYPMSSDPDDDVSIFKGQLNNAKGAVTLTTGQLPSHSHTTNPHTHINPPHAHSEGIAAPTVTTIGLEAPQPSAIPAVGVTGLAAVDIQPATVEVNPTGNGEWVDIRPRWFGVEWWISTR